MRYPDDAVVLINGSMNLAAKIDAIRAFRSDATFMISTEAGGEGINLQDACHVMVNYDLPWNPARLVQRIGRLYRYGQTSKVIVFNVHAADTFDNQAVSLLLDRVMTVAREMAPVGSEYDDSLYAEIVGELLENLDMASILHGAAAGQDARTLSEIEAAVQNAREAKQLQDELLTYAQGFDPSALGGSLGLGMADVQAFISAMLPLMDISISTVTHDGRVLEIRLPDELRGKFPEFHQRTVVRITTVRALAQRLQDVLLLDFESGFFQHLIRYAQQVNFGGEYAVIQLGDLSPGVLAAYRLRWQNDQGEPLVEEFLVGHSSDGQPVTVNPSSLVDWLRKPQSAAPAPDVTQEQRRIALDNIKIAAERRLGDESSRFKHPNGLVLLCAAQTTVQ